MKNAVWNTLSFLAIMAIIAIIVLFSLIFINPYTVVNPFPPATLPAALVLPTFTPTYGQLPPTWTPGGEGGEVVGVTLRPTSTPLATQALVVLNTQTPLPVRTSTATPTKTPTVTPTKSKTPKESLTPSKTPNKTNTALAQIATNAAGTSQAKTATADAGGTGATQTVEAMPPNPGSATETNGALTNTWQNSVQDPAFTWSAVSGAAGYYVYWGTNATGTSTSLVTTNSYDPAAVTTGTYYLRLRTIFSWGGERPDWTTVFIFKFDDSAPSAPVSATETGGTASGTWQNSISDPAFTWTGASDTGSGIARYDVYFGSNPNGTFVVATPSSPSYDPPAVTSGTYFLRVRSVDGVGNESGWTTLFIFRYDGGAPGTPTNLTETSGNPANATPHFTWSASSDFPSGVAAYEIYWGSNGSCGGPNQPDETDTDFTSPALTTAGDYLLCVRARDNAGNVSGWAQTTFTYSP